MLAPSFSTSTCIATIPASIRPSMGIHTRPRMMRSSSGWSGRARTNASARAPSATSERRRVAGRAVRRAPRRGCRPRTRRALRARQRLREHRGRRSCRRLWRPRRRGDRPPGQRHGAVGSTRPRASTCRSRGRGGAWASRSACGAARRSWPRSRCGPRAGPTGRRRADWAGRAVVWPFCFGVPLRAACFRAAGVIAAGVMQSIPPASEPRVDAPTWTVGWIRSHPVSVRPRGE